MREKDLLKIQKLGKRASESAAKVLPRLYEQPSIANQQMMEWTGFTPAGAQRVIDRFIHMQILKPTDEKKKYAQTYMYEEYINIFRDID